MRVKGVREKMSAEQIAALPVSPSISPKLWEHAFAVEPGREYVALGLYSHHGVMWVYFLDEFEQLRVAPLALFVVVDARIPAKWLASIQYTCAR